MNDVYVHYDYFRCPLHEIPADVTWFVSPGGVVDVEVAYSHGPLPVVFSAGVAYLPDSALSPPFRRLTDHRPHVIPAERVTYWRWALPRWT